MGPLDCAAAGSDCLLDSGRKDVGRRDALCVSGSPCKFFSQDLPCSLLKPVSKSCCLYGGGRVASIVQVVRYTPYTSFAKGDFVHDLAISSLHRQFTFVHLFDTHLPRFPRLFPVRSLPKPYGFSSAGWFDNPACTALSMNQLFIIFKRTSWHKQSPQRIKVQTLPTDDSTPLIRNKLYPAIAPATISVTSQVATKELGAPPTRIPESRPTMNPIV